MLFSRWLHSLTNRLARSLSTSRNRIHRRTEWKDRTTHSAQIRRIDELESRWLPSTINVIGTTLKIEYSSSASVSISASGVVQVTGETPVQLSDPNSLRVIHVKPIDATDTGGVLIDLGAVVKSISSPATFSSLVQVTLEGAAGADYDQRDINW